MMPENPFDLRARAALACRAAVAATTLILTPVATPAAASGTGTVAATPPAPAKAAPQPIAAKPAPSAIATTAVEPVETGMTMEDFLDRLMIAESGGNDTAKNPLSTATGAFQFIESTFLSVMQRHFPKRIEKLDAAAILALRTDRKVARDAAGAYTRDNAQILAANGHKPTFPHLRLAFLLGANGALRILDAKPDAPLALLLAPAVLRANPFMRRLTAAGLIARAARDVSLSPTAVAGIAPIRDPKTGKIIMPARAAGPRIRVRCNLSRPSCRRWLALKKRRLQSASRRLAKN